MIRLFFYSFPVVFLFITSSCALNSEKSTNPPVEESRVQSDSVSLEDISIYGNFDEIASIFEEKNDTTYVINFWATWCKPCVEELPYFENLIDSLPNEKMKVILVSLDFPNQLESKLVPFLNENKLKSEIVVLTDGRYNEWIDKVDEDWGGAIPVTVVYNRGNRQFVNRQFENERELQEIVQSFLTAE